jgi:quinohemoprotein amine dehydrogenase alpha subunit-like protein
MKTSTICNAIPCDHSVAERPRYFPRQLITPDDLNLEQDYFRTKLRWHNRLLHGWGVVCGARVCLVPKSKPNGAKFEQWMVRIKPGYILGPFGDEIIIDCARTFDLRTSSLTGMTGEPCVDAADPWCSEVVQQPDSNKLYVAVRYKEVAARPVRVQPIGCGCDDSACENSRLVDGYEITALTYCPDSHANPPSLDDLAKGPIPDCPECPTDPWVVLAIVELDADGNITSIDNCSCRRLVISFGNFWWQCTDTASTAGAVTVDKVEAPDRLTPGATGNVTVLGKNLDSVASVSFGDGVEVKPITPEPAKIVAEITVQATAQPGPRAMVLTDKAGKTIEVKNAISIIGNAPPPKPLPPPPPPTPAPQPRPVGGKSTPSKKRKASDEEV